MDESIRIQTDLFEHREVKSHFINPCCFGEDLAAWLKQELSRQPNFNFELSERIQEDYGWGLWASRGKDRFWVAISYAGVGPQEEPAEFVISVAYDPGLNVVRRIFHKPDRQTLERLRDIVWQIIGSSSGIKIIPTLEPLPK
jgi:hypothetical protein